MLDFRRVAFHYNGMIQYGSSSEWDVEIYVDERGRSPLRDWLSGLDFTIQSRILERFNRLQRGNFGDHKSLSSGLYELRFQFGSGYRVYYGILDNRIVLLLCGGDKEAS